MKPDNFPILLVNPPSHSENELIYPLGLEVLEATLQKRGFNNVNIFDANVDCIPLVEDMINRIRGVVSRTCMVGLSVFPSSIYYSRELIVRLRDEFSDAVEIVIGGYYPSTVGADAYTFFNPNLPDYVVQGRGEAALLDVLEYGKTRPLPNVITNDNGKIFTAGRSKVDLSNVPWASRSKSIRSLRQRTGQDKFPDHCVPVYRLTGCPGNCTFCAVHKYAYDNSGLLKYRSCEDFVLELKYLHDKYGFCNFDIVDDEAIGNSPDDWYKILELLKTHGLDGKIHFTFLTRVEHVVQNPELFVRLQKHGLTSCYCGMESLIERQLKLFNKLRSRLSHVTYDGFLAQVKQSKVIFEGLGIIPQYGYIPMDADSTIDEIETSTHLLQQLGIQYYVPDVNRRLAIYDGTAIQNIYKRRGLILPNKNPSDETWFLDRYNYQFNDPIVGKLSRLVDVWMARLYKIIRSLKESMKERSLNPLTDRSNKIFYIFRKMRDLELSVFEQLISMVKSNLPDEDIFSFLETSMRDYENLFRTEF